MNFAPTIDGIVLRGRGGDSDEKALACWLVEFLMDEVASFCGFWILKCWFCITYFFFFFFIFFGDKLHNVLGRMWLVTMNLKGTGHQLEFSKMPNDWPLTQPIVFLLPRTFIIPSGEIVTVRVGFASSLSHENIGWPGKILCEAGHHLNNIE